MNKMNLYEKIPADAFPIRILEFSEFPEDFVLHWHEHTELLFIKEGVLNLRCGENIISATRGDLIVINGNELHEGIGGRCSFACIYIPPSMFEGQYPLFHHVIRDEASASLLNKILDEHSSKKASDQIAIKGYTYLLISNLINKHSETTFTEIRYRQHADKSVKVNDAIMYIEDNFSEDISTKYLSKLSHVSEAHFCRIFKEATGKSAKEYITEKRLSTALELIKSTDMTILEIAMQCGFSDANYFSRIFKKHKRISPSAFRALRNEKTLS